MILGMESCDLWSSSCLHIFLLEELCALTAKLCDTYRV